VADWLDVIIGARFDSFDIDVFNAAADETRTRKDEEFSPRFGLVLKPQENISIYGSYSAQSFDIIKTAVNGFEAQLQGRVMDDWFVTAGYSYLDGEQADGDLRPRELPENTFSLWNNVQVSDAFGLGLGITYQDESFINNGNTATLPAYTRIDAAAFYDVSDKLRLQVNIENLTDELYFPNAHATHQATVGAPLNAKFTLSGRF